MSDLISKRIILHPMTLKEVELFLKNKIELATQLGLKHQALKIRMPDFTEEINSSLVDFVIPKLKRHPKKFEWYTHWLIIHRVKEVIIGGIGLIGYPDKKGETMVGYYIHQSFEGKGYATEALESLLDWLGKCADLQVVMADTLVDGLASQRVLFKNGFKKSGETPEGIRWKWVKTPATL